MGHIEKNVLQLEKWVTLKKLCHSWKNGLQLITCCTVGKIGVKLKIKCYSWKNGSHLNKGVTVRKKLSHRITCSTVVKMGHTLKKCVVVQKMGHTGKMCHRWKNRSHKKCVTIGKMGLKMGRNLKMFHWLRKWVTNKKCASVKKMAYT